MQSVTPEYKASISQIGRNRGYIRISIGIVNSEAQKNLKVADDTRLTYFSNTDVLQGGAIGNPYATCEENYTKLDGTMYFLPQKDSGMNLYNNGIVVDDFMASAVFDFGSEGAYDIIGFVIDFGDNYPTKFTISSGSDTLEFENNSRLFTSELGLHNVNQLVITPQEMLCGENSRLRIFSFLMGIANTFTNENTISYNEDNYVSAISETLPSSDVEIVVTNYDQYYNPDNEHSAMAFFEEGQEVKVAFGYDVTGNGDIEWLPETVTHLKSWSASDKDATFKSTDIFDYLSGTYYKGEYRVQGISAYDLAIDVLNDAEISKYRVDSYLKNVIIHNPIPPVSHTEALQIIANACRCALYEDRNGAIVIQSDFVPEYYVDSNGESEYSNVTNIGNDKIKIAYAMSSQGFSRLSDSELYFVGEEPDLSSIGYVSEEFSSDDGFFSKNPVITVTMEAAYEPQGFYIQFRNNAPKQFVIRTYASNDVVDEITVSNPDLLYFYDKQLNYFDFMEIEFIQGQGNDRITVDKVLFGAPTDYTISRNMMLDSPKVTRDDKIKAISITKTVFTETSDVKTNTIKIDKASDGLYEVYFSTPSFGFSVRKISGTGSVAIEESSCYRAIIRLAGTSGKALEFSVSYKEYDVNTNQTHVVQHNINGIIKTWENPLISSDEQAELLEKWIADYLLTGIDYEFSWRGDPRTDANDLFYMELKSGEIVNVRGYQSRLSFNGAWSGNMKARKVVV